MASTRSVLQSVADVQVFGSGASPGGFNALNIVSADAPPGHALLRHSNQHPFLHLRISIQYSLMLGADASPRRLYQAVIARYMYRVLDLEGRELFAYHLHPFGLSAVETPHLHFRAAPPFALPTRPGNLYDLELDLSHAHFPTHRIELADLVRFLIRDLGVAPRRPDWELVLSPR